MQYLRCMYGAGGGGCVCVCVCGGGGGACIGQVKGCHGPTILFSPMLPIWAGGVAGVGVQHPGVTLSWYIFSHLALFPLLKHFFYLYKADTVCSDSLIFVLFHFFCISWCWKLFPWAVGYRHLRCYFYIYLFHL